MGRSDLLVLVPVLVPVLVAAGGAGRPARPP